MGEVEIGVGESFAEDAVSVGAAEDVGGGLLFEAVGEDRFLPGGEEAFVLLKQGGHVLGERFFVVIHLGVEPAEEDGFAVVKVGLEGDGFR